MNESTSQAETEEVLTVEGAAKLLHVSRAFVYQEAKAGRLPAFKIGRNVRFTRATLIAWLEKQKVPAPVAASLGRG